ncbi:MAG: ABC transporter permease [Phycisphaeraceae bacterium]|nr:ABC transporter permease [Phycisphaeraceae bacterium]
MYQSLLTRRYMTSKVMPLLSAVVVLLCTMMVLLVWSIMGGFLDMLLSSGRTLMGDVSITWPTTGFAHYDDLIKRLEKAGGIEAAAPLIEAGGMINLPDGRTEPVYIKGVDGPSYAKVVDYASTLWWKPIDQPTSKDSAGRDWRLQRATAEAPAPNWAQLLQDGLRLQESDPASGALVPAAVLGIEVTGFNERHVGGWYTPRPYGVRNEDGAIEWRPEFMPRGQVTINVFPMDRKGRTIDVVSRTIPVANEFKSGIYEIDSKTVLVELGLLQRMLKMDEALRLRPGKVDRYAIEVDPVTGKERTPEPQTMGVEPARVTTVLVRGARDASPDDVAAKCREVYAEFEKEHRGEVPPVSGMVGGVIIQTWRERQGSFVSAVEKETVTVLLILMVLSVAVSFMILAIFWAMISEKTKDIGVLRAIGASQVGIAWLWLRYGMLIGVTGSLLGALTACTIVWNINPIHEWMGRVTGVQVWDPKIYYFVTIPNEVVPWKVAAVVAGGVVFSLLGALIPAFRAARLDPVAALRFE